mmetsp:Transcript_5231/g.19580  ORF Transcript_5231/g.19580 Transcript_5231/m.19580 type:complete len:369 (+) Transcript_5231:540-1646(+)
MLISSCTLPSSAAATAAAVAAAHSVTAIAAAAEASVACADTARYAVLYRADFCFSRSSAARVARSALWICATRAERPPCSLFPLFPPLDFTMTVAGEMWSTPASETRAADLGVAAAASSASASASTTASARFCSSHCCTFSGVTACAASSASSISTAASTSATPSATSAASMAKASSKSNAGASCSSSSRAASRAAAAPASAAASAASIAAACSALATKDIAPETISSCVTSTSSMVGAGDASVKSVSASSASKASNAKIRATAPCLAWPPGVCAIPAYCSRPVINAHAVACALQSAPAAGVFCGARTPMPWEEARERVDREPRTERPPEVIAGNAPVASVPVGDATNGLALTADLIVLNGEALHAGE